MQWKKESNTQSKVTGYLKSQTSVHQKREGWPREKSEHAAWKIDLSLLATVEASAVRR